MAKRKSRGGALREINALDFSGGVQATTTPALSRNNQVLHMINGNIDNRIGGIVGRHGSVTVNNINGVNNMLIYRENAVRKYIVIFDNGTNQIIGTVNNTFSGTITPILPDHFVTGKSVHSTTFAKKEMFFNGENPPRQYDGNSFVEIPNAPTEGKYPEVYLQRLYVLDKEGFLWSSDVISATGDGFTTDAWSNRGINPNDGQRTRALKRHRGHLVIFKDESIYRYDGANEPEPIINIGTHSENGVVRTDTAMFFHHPTGIYKMSLGDPLIISRAVQKYLDGMNPENWETVSTGKDKSNVYFHIGDVTINNPLDFDYQTTYKNVTLVFNFLLERWTIYTGWNANKWFNNKDNGTQYFIKDNGIVKIDTAIYNDDDEAIDFQVLFTPINYGLPQLKKSVDYIMVNGKGMLKVSAGSSHDQMKAIAKENEGIFAIKQTIVFSNLWIGVNDVYRSSPPYIEQLYIDKSYVRNTA